MNQIDDSANTPGNSRQERISKALLVALQQEDNLELRCYAANAIGALGSSACHHPGLVAALHEIQSQSSEPQLRAYTFEALQEIGAATSPVPSLTLHDPYWIDFELPRD